MVLFLLKKANEDVIVFQPPFRAGAKVEKHL
jgi:hypothetical protein